MNLPYHAHRFPRRYWPALDGAQVLRHISWLEVIWAAITVGRPNRFAVLRHGRYSTWEIIFRLSTIGAFLTDRNSFAHSPAFLDLDPSEKSAVSYFFGMTFTKLTAARLFNIPWLIHLDRHVLNPGDLIGRERPDFIGLNRAGGWSVIESKGRSRLVSDAAAMNSKRQTQRIRRINGVFPVLRYGSVTHFRRGLAECILVDPPDIDQDAVNIEITKAQARRIYYEPFYQLMREHEVQHIKIKNKIYRFVHLQEINLKVGMDAVLFDPEIRKADLRNSRIQVPPEKNHNTFVGIDGIALIRCGSIFGEN